MAEVPNSMNRVEDPGEFSPLSELAVHLQDCLLLLDCADKISEAELRNSMLTIVHRKLHSATDKVGGWLVIKHP